jgi:hypothetical protein
VAEQLAVDLAGGRSGRGERTRARRRFGAHRGALSGGGATVAILGSGVDVVYPREHAGLVGQIEQDGAVVSELVPGTPPQAQFFHAETGSSAGCRARSW